MKKLKFLPLLLAALMIFTGFAYSNDYEEGISKSDEIVNTTTAAEKVLLVVSFGTSFNQSRDLTIGGIEAAMKEKFTNYQVRRAFTSQIIIDKLWERDGLRIDNIEQAMDRLVLDGVKEVVVQPTTIMSGYEYDDVVEAVNSYVGKFESLKIGKPLLTDDSDYDAVADLVAAETKELKTNDETTVLLMGHGTEHAANATYAKLQGVFESKGYDGYLIGTVEGGPMIDEVRETLRGSGTKNLVLRPLMIVAGDHANNDMAGDGEDSWKTVLTEDGYTVESVIEGLGQIKGIQELFIKHVQSAMLSDDLTVGGTEPVKPGGVSASRISDGTYPIEVTSSTAMFKIVDCQLTVEDGAMSAVMTLSGQGFSKIYMGTGEAAGSDSEENFIGFTDNGGKNAFTVPVAALDAGLDCAGFSARKEEWYDHTVVFESKNIPDSAFLPCVIDAELGGGTGRAGIESPVKLFRKDGADHAEITWSSPNYSYMLVGGVKYLPVNEGGNSVFEIPVTVGVEMDITACTTAMSAPKEIEYTLTLDPETIQYE
ncbi:MAG: sirohydrochlorin cobaltochelatase [Clostridiales bacterium]|nr:sirohydrochlorin cobaltochelatase [Clostridiales bacterium]